MILTAAIEILNKYVDEIEITKEMSIDERALYVASQAHGEQTRWNNDAYITHPIRVAATFDNATHRAAAYLHDVVEDTPLTLDDLRKFGFSEEIVLAVDSVTKRRGESYLDFILRARKHPIGRDVKIADIRDNLSDLTDRNKTMRDKYQLALWILKR